MQFLNFDVEDYNFDQFLNFNLEGVIYTFRFRYNSRDGWYLAIYDPAKFIKDEEDNTEALLYGEVKVMPSQNILKHTVSESLPDGYLSFIDTELKSYEDYALPSFDNIGTDKRFLLCYWTRAELVDTELEKYL
ncbi:virion structural protein [Vibrio phage F99]|nr:hypothetical protein MYOV056v2_p0057 [Vibrio phage 184E37.3a]QZI87088.1 hypothetical protein MYOV085v1_p0066 [Vibrio phage 355E48.1]QZI89997.1 hypothetical protein MYOV057v1_p0082 [Vibrio phage 184E37.1]